MGRKSPICTEWVGFEVFSGIISARCGAGDAERQTSDPFLTSILTYTVNDVVADTLTCSDHELGPFLPFAGTTSILV